MPDCSPAPARWRSANGCRSTPPAKQHSARSPLKRPNSSRLPEEEEQELALIYEAKGLPEDLSRSLAKELIGNKKTALDTLVREELGIDPDELGGSAWTAAGTSFALFAVGAIFPVAPYFALVGLPAVIASLAASGVALFAIGAGTVLFTGRGFWFSGLRQLAVGLAAAGVTFGVGRLIGVAVAG